MRISVINIRSLIANVKRLGFPTEELMRALQLPEQQLADACLMVSADDVEEFLAQALALTGRPDLGLSVGGAAPEFRLMSHFAQALPSLRDAISMLRRYSPIFIENMHVELSESEGVGSFCYSFGGFPPLCERFFSEVFAGHCVGLAQSYFTEGMAPLEVRFRHPEPAYSARYRQVFGCPVQFESEHCAISFESAVLDRQQPLADSFMAELLRDACERMLNALTQPASLVERVRLMLARQSDLCSIDTEAVAREMGISPRSLRAELAEEGQTFSALLEEARIGAAAGDLLQPGLTIKEVAAKLGYSEVSAFHRAFKRWMGKPPGEYIREKRTAS